MLAFSNRSEDEDSMSQRLSTASSVSTSSSSSSSLSSKRPTSSNVIGKKILFEQNSQKATEKMASKSIQTTPTLGGRIAMNGGEWLPSAPVNDPTQQQQQRTDNKYFRNIVVNTADKSKLLSSHNDLNVQINRTSPIKSVKLLNNFNALKLK